jgi:hypothetical protein
MTKTVIDKIINNLNDLSIVSNPSSCRDLMGNFL